MLPSSWAHLVLVVARKRVAEKRRKAKPEVLAAPPLVDNLRPAEIAHAEASPESQAPVDAMQTLTADWEFDTAMAALRHEGKILYHIGPLVQEHPKRGDSSSVTAEFLIGTEVKQLRVAGSLIHKNLPVEFNSNP